MTAAILILRAQLGAEKLERAFLRLTPEVQEIVAAEWQLVAQTGQSAPQGDDWFAWLIMAGRGFGKTRAGAEWVHGLAREAVSGTRIALVAATLAEARSVMVEGESGLLTTAKPGREPLWFPATGKLIWPSGAMARLHSAESFEAIRGAQFHYAWCDEIAKWANADGAWDNLVMALRLGDRPRVLATTTPRPVGLVRRLVSQIENPHPEFRVGHAPRSPDRRWEHVGDLDAAQSRRVRLARRRRRADR